MKLRIHYAAAENFDKKAVELLGLVEELRSPPVSKKTEFPSELHSVATITEKDIVGEIEVIQTDYQGRTTGRSFKHKGKEYGLGRGNYSHLMDIAENIQSIPEVRCMLSLMFIEKELFVWITKTYLKEKVSERFIEYLDKRASESIKKITTWIPIANIEVETPFKIAYSEIRPITKALMDNWSSNILASDKNNPDTIKIVNQMRKEYQGLAAVVTEVEAEPEQAYIYSFEEAKSIIAILAIFSGAVLVPDVRSIYDLKGSEFVPKITTFYEYENDIVRRSSKILDERSYIPWKLRTKEIEELRKIGLEKVSDLLKLEKLNDYKKSILNAIMLYSKAAFTADPIEKVVNALSAMESILLKNENEPIQQNLGERLAFFMATQRDERKRIVKVIKDIYRIRSKYIHHGHPPSELMVIKVFLEEAWLFILQLIENIDRFQKRIDFVNAIDDRKMT